MERWRKLGRKQLLLLPSQWVEDVVENAFALLFRTGLAGAGPKLLDLMHPSRILSLMVQIRDPLVSNAVGLDPPVRVSLS